LAAAGRRPMSTSADPARQRRLLHLL